MITIGGKVHNVPDVYGTIKVIDQIAGTPPEFNGLLIVGDALTGVPYNAGTGDEVFIPFSSVAQARKFYGDCELVDAFAQAKKGGAGVCFLTTANTMTQTMFYVLDTDTTPILKITSNGYGMASSHIIFALTNVSLTHLLTISITPPKNICKVLSRDGIKYFLSSVEGFQVGDTIYNGVGDDAFGITIGAINVDEKSVTPTVYNLDFGTIGIVYMPDSSSIKTKTFTTTDLTCIQQVVDFINSTGILTAEVHTGEEVGNIQNANAVSTFIGALAGETDGQVGNTVVATTTASGGWDTFVSLLPQKMEEFRNVKRSRIRIVNVVSPNASVHGYFKTGALTLRGLQNSIQVVTGVGKTGGVLDELLATSDSAHPIKRTLALNSDDVILASVGLDGLPAYLTLAPQFAGMMNAMSVRRNFTADTIDATSVNKFFGEYNKELDTSVWLKAGCLIAGTSSDAFFIIQAINTYLRQDKSWNENDNKTYLIQQRQIADFVFESLRKELKPLVGNESATETSVSLKMSKLTATLKAEGYLKPDSNYSVSTVNGSIIATPNYKLIDSVDFIGFVEQIILS